MKRPTGRPPKPPGQKHLIRSFSCPPDLWEQVEASIPHRERSALIQEAFRREIARRKQELLNECESERASE